MKNLFIWLLIFLLVLVFISLAIDPNRAYQNEERYDAYVTYDQIESCNQYVWFMECVIDRIDDVTIQRIYKNNIYTTVRNRAEIEDSEALGTACNESLLWLAQEDSLHEYWCEIDSDDPLIRDLVNPNREEPEVIVEDIVVQTWANEVIIWSWQIDSNIQPLILTWGEVEIEEESAENKLDEILEENITAYTRVQVLQNRVWFLRIRERATTNSFEIWRLWIWDVVDALDKQSGWYLIRYWNEWDKQWWVSSKYVRNIWLPDWE